ncbi:hypothetical protein E4T39_06598 [Aureobasidium subglaciale]|nr:hypothetical protein E4T39_06598 [Aureobasidium subglaciale]
MAKQVSEPKMEYQVVCSCSTDARTRSRLQRSDQRCHTSVLESDYVVRKWCERLKVYCSIIPPIAPPHKLIIEWVHLKWSELE